MDEKKKKKSPRKRKKGLYGNVIQQMEFYFGDANLARDRFLKQQVDLSEDGYVDLTIFLKFNKMRSLTDDVEVISKALAHSDLLQLSEDKMRVRRKTPFTPPKDTSERTVYVECLPHKTDHEWITKLFSSCGKVAYVSLPKYKSTGDIKGFAFVEFEDAESARKACEELNNPPAEASEKPGKFPKFNKQMQYYKERLEHAAHDKESEKADDSTKLRTPESPGKSKKAKKRRRQTSESSVDGSVGGSISSDKRPSVQSTEERVSDSSANDGSPRKKRKTQSRESQDSANVGKEARGDVKSKQQADSVKSDEEASNKRKHFQGRKSIEDSKIVVKTDRKADKKEKGGSSCEESKQSESSDSSARDLPREGKKRKHSDRQSLDTHTPVKLAKHETEEDKTISSESRKKKEKKRKRKKNRKEKSLPELRVISKKEWLDLKKEYLVLQKKSMKELKESLKQAKQNVPQGQGEDQSKKVEVKTEEVKTESVEIPGVIVKVQHSEDMNRKQVKEDLPEGVDVAYIDVIEGSREGFIRFKDADSAKKVTESSIKSYVFTLLSGNEEKTYWEKLKSDREAKHNQKSKRSKKRGSQKLIDRAEKINKENVSRVHIKFEEDD